MRSYARPSVKRHYTVSTCMMKDLYDEYLRVCRCFERSEAVNFDETLLQENWETRGQEIVFTVKNYKTLTGLSHRLHLENHKDLFQIKALMGKGLGIQRSGTHVAFLAGTGILIFIDLVAFLIRYNLGLLNVTEREIISEENFKFILHVSFPRKEEAVAIEMLEAL